MAVESFVYTSLPTRSICRLFCNSVQTFIQLGGLNMAASESGGVQANDDPGAGKPSPGELTAQFKVGKADVDVHLSHTHISWDKSNRKDKAKFSNSVDTADIIAVKDAVLDKQDKTVNGFTIHFLSRNKNYIWKVATVSFQAEDEATRKIWLDSLQHRLNSTVIEQHRPQNVVVFINPKSGNSHGVTIYEKHGAPLFDLAGIKTKVTVTERSGHIVEQLQHCDLDGIDGIIVVGGDGTLTEGVEGALKRYMKEAGRDINNPDEELVSCPIRIGLIPAGTGQGMTLASTGTYDITTAVLHIIMGHSESNDVMSVYNDGHLLGYSLLLIGYGYFGELIKYAESHRSLGKIRYLLSVFKGMTSFMTYYDFDVHYLPADDAKPDPQEKLEAVEPDGWLKAPGPFVSLFITPMDVKTLEPLNGTCPIHLFTKTSRLGVAKTFMNLQKYKPDSFERDCIMNLKAKMVKLVNGPISREAGDKAQTASGGKQGSLTEIVNIDGEVHQITHPEVLIRFHGANYRLFGNTPVLHEMRQKLKEQSSTENST